jgi:hypothetical protein
MHTVLFGVAVILLLFGLVGMPEAFRSRRRRRRVLATPSTPIAEARGGFVEVCGTVVPGEQGVVTAPFSGRSCVWLRVIVFEKRASGRSTRWVEVADENESTDFLVDDGSGERALVRPAGARFELDQQRVATSGTFNDPTPELEAFLQNRGIQSAYWLGINKAMRYEEQAICAGDPLYALGPSERVPLADPPQGYRSGRPTQLVLAAGPSKDEELLLSNKTERDVLGRLGADWIVAWGCLGLAVILGAAAVLMAGAGY